MAKKTDKEIKQAEAHEMYDALLKANKEIQEGTMDGLVRGSTVDGHFIPFSHSLGTGGAGFSDNNQTRAIKNIREADKAYREVGIVRNVVDIMTDFTAEGLNVHHPVVSQERFYRAWLKKVNMDEIAKQSLRGMYKWANIGIFRFWGKIRPKTKKEMMAKARELFAEGKNKEAVKAFFRDDSSVKRGRIPVRYSCLPPFRIRIGGSLLFDTRSYNYSLAENDRQKLLDPKKFMTREELKLSKELPDSLKIRIQQDGRIVLPPEHFTMLHYKRDCSRLWADPIILPIMNDLRYKQVLRRLDISVAESIINPITIFKLGDTPGGFAPTKEQFQNLANLLKTPVATKTLVWSDLIEVEQHIVDAKEVFAMEKYHEVDLDILNGLGVSLTLINGGAGGGGGGGGSKGAQAFLSVRTLLERLEDGRQEFMKFLAVELEFIRKAMGWKRAPKVTWDQMNLRDEAARERIMIELRDRKIISNESLLDMFDMDNDIEMSRKGREEKQFERSGTTMSVGPFEEQVRVQKDEDPQRLALDMQKEQVDKQMEQQERMADKQNEFNDKQKDKDIQLKKQQTSNTTAPRSGPGRPAGKGDPESRKQKKKRDTKPQSMGSVSAELIEQSLANRAIVEHYIKPKYLKAIEKDNLRQLTKDEKNTYNKLIESVWSFTNPLKDTNMEFVEYISADVAKTGTGKKSLDSNGHTVNSIYGYLVGEYREENHKFPSERISRELFATALVIFNKNF